MIFLYSLTLLSINLVLFWKTLSFGWANDDFEIARCSCDNPDIKQIKNLKGDTKEICAKCNLLKRKEARDIWQKIWWHLIGVQYTDKKLAHTLVMIIHNLVCLLVYFAFGHNQLSFMAALIFAVHPAACQGSSVWLSGKGYGMGAIFSLLMFVFPILAFLLYPLSFYAGMNAISSPLIFIKTQWWGLVFIIPVIFFWKKRKILQHTSMKFTQVSKVRKPTNKDTPILFFKTIGYYFAMCLFPVRLGIHPRYLETYGLTEEESRYWIRPDKFLFMGIILTVYALLGFFFYYDTITFGIVWFLIFLLPWSNIISIHQFIAERYITVALIGYCWAVVNALSLIPDERIRYALYAGLIVRYASRTYEYLPFFEEVLKTAEENVRNFPDSFSAWRWKGGLEKNLGLINEAAKSWFYAWKCRPNDFVTVYNLACVFAANNNFNEARKFLDMAVKAPLPETKEKDRQVKVSLLRIEILNREANIKRGITQIPRNQPCPCGSDKKYKNCCGKLRR